MTDVQPITFDFQGLYIALDALRHARGLSWQKAAKEIKPSTSTLKNISKAEKMEADGVMCMLQWLGAPASKFVREGDPPPDFTTQLETLLRSRKDLSADAVAELSEAVRSAYEPLRTGDVTRKHRVPSTRHPVLGYKRLHIGGIFDALDAKREARGLTWKEVAEEIGYLQITPQTLIRFAKGGRTTVPNVMYMLEWLGLPIEVFLRKLAPPEYRNEPDLPPADLMKQVGVLLNAREDLSDEGISELEEIVRTKYNRLQDRT